MKIQSLFHISSHIPCKKSSNLFAWNNNGNPRRIKIYKFCGNFPCTFFQKTKLGWGIHCPGNGHKLLHRTTLAGIFFISQAIAAGIQDGIAGLRSLPRHSVDMLLTDPPYGTTRNFWDVPLPLPELWEAVKWAVKPEGAVLFFAQCPYDKVLGASNLPMLRYEWVWYKSRCTGFLNARRAPLKKTENILVFYQKLPLYNPQFEQGKPYKKIAGNRGDSTNYGKFIRSGSGSEDGLRFPGNVLAFPTVQRTVHPTQKPVALSEYFIKTYTRPGEVVADICAGSGSTAVAALNTGRRFICFETVPAYYAAASERIRAARAAVEAGEKGV